MYFFVLIAHTVLVYSYHTSSTITLTNLSYTKARTQRHVAAGGGFELFETYHIIKSREYPVHRLPGQRAAQARGAQTLPGSTDSGPDRLSHERTSTLAPPSRHSPPSPNTKKIKRKKKTCCLRCIRPRRGSMVRWRASVAAVGAVGRPGAEVSRRRCVREQRRPLNNNIWEEIAHG